MANDTTRNSVPNHVAIIMDGSGRWAQRRGLKRLDGHKAGTQNIAPVADAFIERGVRYLTLYAFSTENWGRPKMEIKGLIRILGNAIKSETETFHRKGVRLLHLGRLDRLSGPLQKQVRQAVDLTRHNSTLCLSLAFDYGGRDEILSAVRHIVQEGISPDAIDEALLTKHLYTAELPEVDLLIRTGGETRLSNFLLWQLAYAELYFTPVLWPDFGKDNVEEALAAYSQKERRFGKLA